jgi:hypothetical protein
MDWATVGTAGGTGFVASVLTLLGWNRRLSKVEDSIEKLFESKLNIKEFEARHLDLVQNINLMREDSRRIEAKLDRLFDRLINGKQS